MEGDLLGVRCSFARSHLIGQETLHIIDAETGQSNPGEFGLRHSLRPIGYQGCVIRTGDKTIVKSAHR